MYPSSFILQESAKKIFQSVIQKHALLFTDKESEIHGPSMDVFRTVAGAFKGQAIFVNVPTSEERVYEYFGITKEQTPTIVFADMGSESGMMC